MVDLVWLLLLLPDAEGGGDSLDFGLALEALLLLEREVVIFFLS